MSDSEDILGDDLGDQSLADYNLGNEEEEQLLADDYENASSQNVPGRGYRDSTEVAEFSQRVEYTRQVSLERYQTVDSECVVPNVTVEVTHTSVHREHRANYAPYGEVPVYEQEQHGVVPPAIPAAPMESPQIVPSELPPHAIANGDNAARERFPSERPPGAQRAPQVRDIPDSLDKVYIPRGGFGRGQRTTWRNPQYQPRHPHPYRRHNVNRGHFLQQQMNRVQFPPRPQIRPNPPQLRPEPPQIRPEPPQIRLEAPHIIPQKAPEQRIISPEMPPVSGPPIFRPMNPQNMERPPFQPNPTFSQRFPNPPSMQNQQNPPNFRPDIGPRPNFHPNIRPPFDSRPPVPYQFQQRPQFNQRPQYPLPAREIVPSSISHMPQVTIRQAVPLNAPPGVPGLNNPPKLDEFPPKVTNPPPEYNPREPEVRMLPVQLPTSLPPGGLAGKKVLINPHFKGNFQPPVEGPIKDVDDAAERFIAEQRNALARAATRKFPRRSPQRYIENTTIEIENELAHGDRPRRHNEEDDLLRRQEEFINANRAGLRRRMRSPSPVVRRSPSPRRSLSPRRRPSPPPRHHDPLDEESEYRRRLREQESLRERVLRAKEVRRKKNAVALQKQIQDRERERQQHAEKENTTDKQIEPVKDRDNKPPHREQEKEMKLETEKDFSPRDRSPHKQKTDDVIEKTKEIEVANKKEAENFTPPRKKSIDTEVKKSPERALTPPLPVPIVVQKRRESKEKISSKSDTLDESILDFEDDDLDLILGDIDGILSDDEDTGRFKEKAKKSVSPPKAKLTLDLRQKIPPKNTTVEKKSLAPRQKIVFSDSKGERAKQEKVPSKRNLLTSSTKDDENIADVKNKYDIKKEADTNSLKQRQRIIFGAKEVDAEGKMKQSKLQQSFNNRRVVLQRKLTAQEKPTYTRVEKSDPSRPNPGIFSRAVKKAIGAAETNRLVLKHQEEPKIEYDMDSDVDEDSYLDDSKNLRALVTNLPHGMTETRLRTLAGDGIQTRVAARRRTTTTPFGCALAPPAHCGRRRRGELVGSKHSEEGGRSGRQVGSPPAFTIRRYIQFAIGESIGPRSSKILISVKKSYYIWCTLFGNQILMLFSSADISVARGAVHRHHYRLRPNRDNRTIWIVTISVTTGIWEQDSKGRILLPNSCRLPTNNAPPSCGRIASTCKQSIDLDKPERRANLTFRTPEAAEAFRKKFNNKMVAASKLSVVLS